jgi:FKBP-type peptidyl-prolyl cis-trans isomerase
MKPGDNIHHLQHKALSMTLIRHMIWLGVALAISACGSPATDQGQATVSTAPATPAATDTVTTSTTEIVPGLTMRMLREGTGVTAEVSHIAVVHYTGWLFDPTAEFNRGDKFDSSVDRGQHFEFPLGARRVIRGWDEGVVGMKVGEIRELTIAPELAYGDRQVGAIIPPGSTLVFEVELAGLKRSDGEPITSP